MPYLFNGKELDVATGLYYYGARYYDPHLSQWVSKDPALANFIQGIDTDPKHLGLYAYAFNNRLC